MSAISDLITNYSAFNLWANQRLVDWLRTLDLSILYKHAPSSFTTIDYTVQHVLRTQKFWHGFVMRRDLSDFSWKIFENRAEETLLELESQSAAMHENFMSFSENELMEQLELDMPWAKNQRSRYDYIMHVINHSSFHRGQVVTQARALGIQKDIPATDYNIFNCL